MTYSQFDPVAQSRVPLNFGAKIGPKRPFNQKQIWAIRFFLDREKRIRDHALFDLAIDSKLRVCDLVELKIGDIVSGLEVRKRAAITQRKTGRPVQFEIASDARVGLFAWVEWCGDSVALGYDLKDRKLLVNEPDTEDVDEKVCVTVQAKLVYRGPDHRFLISPGQAVDPARKDATLIKPMVTAHAARRMLIEGGTSDLVASYSEAHLT